MRTIAKGTGQLYPIKLSLSNPRLEHLLDAYGADRLKMLASILWRSESAGRLAIRAYRALLLSRASFLVRFRCLVRWLHDSAALDTTSASRNSCRGQGQLRPCMADIVATEGVVRNAEVARDMFSRRWQLRWR